MSSKRLPTTIRPIHYTVIINPISNDKFYGTVLISANVSKKRKTILLNIDNITILKVKVSYPLKKIHQEQEILYLIFDQPLLPGDITIEIQYMGIITNDLKGLYRSSYKDKKDKEHIVLSTQFESTFARRVLPCFDEPNFKAVFSLILIIESHLSAFSNMPILERKSYDSNHDCILFASSPPMSTYTFAFVIGEYSISTYKKFSIICPIFTELSDINFSLHVALSSMQKYEKLLGIKYTLPKLDLIAIPESAAGAMENWGLVTFAPETLMVYPEYSSEDDKYYVASTISHELSHQFFGNLDTTQWWNTIWLNEGIATYFEYIGIDAAFPEWNIWETFIFQSQQYALNSDSLFCSHPMNNSINTVDEIAEMFDTITYDKGGSILYMIADIIGEPFLFKGLHYYLSNNQYKNVTPNILWKSIDDSVINLSKVMPTWTDQSGFPLITVIEYENGIKLHQERYIPYNENKKDKDKLWWISTLIKCEDGR